MPISPTSSAARSGHTLQATIDQAAARTGVAPERIYADKGYRGHDYQGEAQVIIAGRRRGLTPTMQRELRRRSAIEPMIGHAKNDGRLGRNWLLGPDGDKINATLAAAGHNLRLVLNKLRLLFARILGAIVRFWAPAAPIWALGTDKSVFVDTGFPAARPSPSMA
jgi:IS5 family transposase